MFTTITYVNMFYYSLILFFSEMIVLPFYHHIFQLMLFKEPTVREVEMSKCREFLQDIQMNA